MSHDHYSRSHTHAHVRTPLSSLLARTSCCTNTTQVAHGNSASDVWCHSNREQPMRGLPATRSFWSAASGPIDNYTSFCYCSLLHANVPVRPEYPELLQKRIYCCFSFYVAAVIPNRRYILGSVATICIPRYQNASRNPDILCWFGLHVRLRHARQSVSSGPSEDRGGGQTLHTNIPKHASPARK